MTFLTQLSTMFMNTLAGILAQLPIFILIIWAVKTIVKQMPSWIQEYFKLKIEQEAIVNAKSYFKGMEIKQDKSKDETPEQKTVRLINKTVNETLGGK